MVEERIMVLLEKDTYQELEVYAKKFGCKRYGDAVKLLLEKQRPLIDTGE